jgi:peptidoglycan/LPS O-acetylase OafA/YrhL
VISGYLITCLLLDEMHRTGSVSLGGFYLRRTLRIFPPYYAFLIVLGVMSSAGMLALNDGDLSHAVTYTSNYDLHRSWFVGHTWSLSVEEQFYLLWPVLFLAAGRRRALVVAACVVLAAPLIRIASWELLRSTSDGIGHRFETVFDAIAIGCVLAGARSWLHRNALYRRALESPLFVAVPLAGIAGNLLGDHPVAHFLIGMTVTNIAAAATIDWCVTFAEGRVGRLLNAAPMVFVGTMSYSLYLWQQLFLNRAATNTMSTFPFNIVLAFACALASYHMIEQPSLGLRRRIERASRRRAAAEAPALAQLGGAGLAK